MKALHITIHPASLLVALVLAASPVAYSAGNFYQQHNLVADVSIPDVQVDPNLVNAWGWRSTPMASSG
jgi:hypothetical protein